MAVFIVFWPYLLTPKLRCLQRKNIGHTNGPIGYNERQRQGAYNLQKNLKKTISYENKWFNLEEQNVRNIQLNCSPNAFTKTNDIWLCW